MPLKFKHEACNHFVTQHPKDPQKLSLYLFIVFIIRSVFVEENLQKSFQMFYFRHLPCEDEETFPLALSYRSAKYLNSIRDKLMIVTVLIRYKSWQSQISFRSYFIFTRFSVFFILFLHIMHINYGKFIFYLHSIHTRGARGGDTLFNKFFILKYGSSRSTWNNFSSSLRSLFHFASLWRWKFLLYFSIYGDICTIYLFFMISFLAKLSTEKLCRKSTNKAGEGICL